MKVQVCYNLKEAPGLYETGSGAFREDFPCNLLLFGNRNPDLRAIAFIGSPLRVLVRVVIHFDAVTRRELILL